MKERFTTINCLAGLLVLFVWWGLDPAEAVEFPYPPGRQIHVETLDGAVFWGELTAVDAEILSVRTPFGSLQVPMTQAARINGDRFDPAVGLIHEQELIIQANGDGILEFSYLLPFQSHQSTAILVLPGRVLAVKDGDGRDLAFSSLSRGRLTHAEVVLPSNRLAAVRIRMLLPGAVECQGETLRYLYRYVPAWPQNFCLRIRLPVGYDLGPLPIPFEKTGESHYVCRLPLENQQKIAWPILAQKQVP